MNLGFSVNWWMAKATIVGSQTLTIKGTDLDTWFVNATFPDSPYPIYGYYDKQTGVLVKLTTQQGSLMQSLVLADTNVLILG